MVPHPLGRTGLSVSPVALGTVKLGRNTGVRYPAAFELPSDAEVDALLGRALSLGVTLLDTAPAYGSEARLKSWARKFQVCTKAGERHEGGASSWDFSPEGVAASLDESLRRLGRDTVEILLLHSDGKDVENLGRAGEALLRLRKSGKARFVGLSAKTAEGIDAAAKGGMDVVMAPYSGTKPELAPALERAASAGLGVLAIKVLDSGHAAQPAEAFAHAASRPFVHSLVVGTLDTEHLTEAITAVQRGLRAR